MRLLKVILILVCITGVVAFLWLENCLSGISLGIAFVFYFLASVIHLLAHETGHLIGGKLTGYKLLYLHIGPLNIMIKQNDRVDFLWGNTHGGQCIMIPKEVTDVRFKAYNMGGVLANILINVLSFSLLLFNSFYLSLLCIELLFVGLNKILVNLIPHKTNSIPNDGYVVKLLKRDKAIQKDYAMYLKLYANLFLNESISPEEYKYERELSQDIDDMLYYNEIQDILKSLESQSV